MFEGDWTKYLGTKGSGANPRLIKIFCRPRSTGWGNGGKEKAVAITIKQSITKQSISNNNDHNKNKTELTTKTT